MQEYLRDASGGIIAIITQHATHTTIHSPGGQYLGYYSHSNNTTYDASGNRIGSGNHLVLLI